MDLPRKRSNKYVTAVYAIFIILFAFTATLFYASRCQESGRLVQQDDDIRKSKAAAENPPVVTHKIYIAKEPSQDKTPERLFQPGDLQTSRTAPARDAVRHGSIGQPLARVNRVPRAPRVLTILFANSSWLPNS